MKRARYGFRRVGADDLPMLARWRSLPHVARWWGDADAEPDAEKMNEPDVRMWIAEHEFRPIGYVQDYLVADWSPHPFDMLPTGARGIDMYIGDPAMIGIGHGSALLRQFSDMLLDAGAPALGIDPHPDNAPAIRAFEKAGFRVATGPVDTPWGRAVLMTRHASVVSALRGRRGYVSIVAPAKAGVSGGKRGTGATQDPGFRRDDDAGWFEF